ncbi:MAG: hypothetical protein O7H41_13430 [Planctomycetota bacterium]|nr:hypothetical protein [Planctomycetota bacterium]
MAGKPAESGRNRRISSRRAPSGRSSSARMRAGRAPARGNGDGSGVQSGGFYLLLFGLPVVVLAAGLVLYATGGKKAAPPPLVNQVDDYGKSQRLEHEAEPHIRRFFQAKRAGNKSKVQSEFKLAREKLISAMELLEGLKMKYTSDHTLEGNLPDAFAYLDADLSRISETHSTIIKEMEY